MRDLILKIIKTSGAKIYSVLLGIITLAIVARWLGPEGMGIVATVSTWVQIFVEVTGLSLGSVLIFKATQARHEGWLASIMGVLLKHTLIVTLLSWIIIAILYIGGEYWNCPKIFGEIPAIAMMVGFIVLPFSLWDLYTSSLLNIEDRLSVYNKYQVFGSTANAVSIVVLVVIAGFWCARRAFLKSIMAIYRCFWGN